MAFGKEHTTTSQTVSLTLMMATAGGVVQFEVPFFVLPSDRQLITSGQTTLREQLSLDILEEAEKRAMKSSGDGAT